LISILFLTSLNVFSQSAIATNNALNQNKGATNLATSSKSKKSHELPESLLNLEIQYENLLGGGISKSYGGYGVKGVIGSNNTGVLLGYMFGYGASSDSSITSYNSTKLGYQYGIVRGFYANANFNLARTRTLYLDNGLEKISSIRVNIGVGYTFSFGKRKRIYYNLETGFAVINTQDLISRLCINSGIGFRLGTPAKTSYEGVKNVTTVPMK
jgi:hypothetical protein